MGQYPFFLTLIFGLFSFVLSAQEVDTSLVLPEVLFKESRHSDTFSDSLEFITLNTSTVLQLEDIGAQIALQSPIFIRRYGQGGLASISFRGGNAAQTNLYWQGFDLNSQFVGQVDLSLIPSWFFDRVSINNNPNNASGQLFAPAGGLSLYQNALLNQSSSLKIQAQAGSFSQYSGGLKALLRQKRHAHEIAFFQDLAQNDYPYLNILGLASRLPNAQTNNRGIQTRHSFLLFEKWQLEASVWHQKAQRQIPPTAVQLSSTAQQSDEQFRATIQNKWYAKNWKLSLNSAYLQEQIIYTDSLTNINSNSFANSLINRFTTQNQFKNAGLQLSFEHSLNQASGNNFEFNILEHRWTARLSFQQLLIKQWQLKGQIAPLFVNESYQPLAGNISLAWVPNQAPFSWHLNASKVRRLPTFNDRFWRDQGNPDLFSEMGWAFETSGTWKKQLHRVGLQSKLLSYYRKIDNWILWLPEAGVWQALNVRSVSSYGLEAQFNFALQINKVNQLKIDNHYSWTQSIPLSPIQGNDQSVGKQLIYTPIHQFRSLIQLNTAKWKFQIIPSFTGKVFTLADNSSSLPSYWLFHTNLEYQWNPSWNLHFMINNLFNKKYEVIIQRPMPGIHFSGGVTFYLSKKQKL